MSLICFAFLFFLFIFWLLLVVSSDLGTYCSCICFNRCTCHRQPIHWRENEYIGEIHLGTCQISSTNCCIRTWKAVIHGGKLKPGYWFLRALGIFWKMLSDRITDHLCWDTFEKNMEAITNLAWRAECFAQPVLIHGLSPAVEIWVS